MEKTLATLIEVQQLQANNIAWLITVQQKQADRADKTDSGIENLTAKVDGLVGAIRALIERIPPENLR